jgi:DNA-binding response OmpR family regulator
MVGFTDSIEWTSKLRRQAEPEAVPESFHVGPVVVHPRTGRVRSSSGEVQLRPKELELLLHLYTHVTVTFTRQELLRLVWCYHADLFTRTVDQTMATLRKKIEPDPEQPRFLQTVHRNGYRLVL